MPVIDISLIIAAPIERSFDLSRSIDLHLEFLSHTWERAVACVVSGLIAAAHGGGAPEDGTGNDEAMVERAVRANIHASVDHLRHGSEVLEQLIQDAALRIVGAEYSLESGVVKFFDEPPASGNHGNPSSALA